VSTVPGEETVLLAKSMLSHDANGLETRFAFNEYVKSAYGEYSDFGADYYEIYGAGNMIGGWSAPVEEYLAEARNAPLPDYMPNCHELTITLKVPESYSDPHRWEYSVSEETALSERINGTDGLLPRRGRLV
jgi:hypothetical protein